MGSAAAISKRARLAIGGPLEMDGEDVGREVFAVSQHSRTLLVVALTNPFAQTPRAPTVLPAGAPFKPLDP